MSLDIVSRPTIVDVARAANVSLGTVSRVLNRHANVDPGLRAHVEQTIRQLGFEPSAVAQSLRGRATRTIGCILRDISIPGLATFVKAVEATLTEVNYTLILANTDGRQERERELVGLLGRRQADGLIASIGLANDPELLTALRAARFPVVVLDAGGEDWADSVSADHFGGALSAITHLLQLGHRRIALLTGRPVHLTASQHIAAYEQAFRQSGTPLNKRFIHTESFTPEFGYARAMALFDNPDGPTAIFAGGMDMIWGVLRAAKESRRSIPGDISVIAGCDSDFMNFSAPAITAVRYNLTDMGRSAAEMLLGRIHGQRETVSQTLVLPTALILRASTAPPPHP
ncbi:MAG: LacI family DNA-binding transcriptional regulator [Candidatus Lambdaproteobacteria bacterium]|nr:LacI family DNA-binding transcriptional regulator [Candidatus Lambdaproteobacteria bacterium]